MFQKEIDTFHLLNDLAVQGGTVIFGGSEDRKIPLCELKQAFDLDDSLYNRSLDGLSVMDARDIYDSCVAELSPDVVLLHLGAADLKYFSKDPAAFDFRYRQLIGKIREHDKKCEIVIVSLKNYSNDEEIAEMNRHLKHLAESERCEYADISARKVWNPRETKEVVSFVYSMGFGRPLGRKRPVYDLVKILFCYEQ